MLDGIKFKNIFFIILGAAIFSFGLVHFNIQNELAEGGFTGITLILLFAFKWDPAIMNLILNIPMFIIGWKLLGKRVFIYTVIGTVAVSVFLKIFMIYQIDIHLKDDMFLVAFFAGCLSASGSVSFLDTAEQLVVSILSHVWHINTSAGVWERRCFFSMRLSFSFHGLSIWTTAR